MWAQGELSDYVLHDMHRNGALAPGTPLWAYRQFAVRSVSSSHCQHIS